MLQNAANTVMRVYLAESITGPYLPLCGHIIWGTEAPLKIERKTTESLPTVHQSQYTSGPYDQMNVGGLKKWPRLKTQISDVTQPRSKPARPVHYLPGFMDHRSPIRVGDKLCGMTA